MLFKLQIHFFSWQVIAYSRCTIQALLNRIVFVFPAFHATNSKTSVYFCRPYIKTSSKECYYLDGRLYLDYLIYTITYWHITLCNTLTEIFEHGIL